MALQRSKRFRLGLKLGAASLLAMGATLMAPSSAQAALELKNIKPVAKFTASPTDYVTNAGGYNFGFYFETTYKTIIDALGVFDYNKDGFDETHNVYLYNIADLNCTFTGNFACTGAPIAQTAAFSGTSEATAGLLDPAQSFRWKELVGGPITLGGNNGYVVVATNWVLDPFVGGNGTALSTTQDATYVEAAYSIVQNATAFNAGPGVLCGLAPVSFAGCGVQGYFGANVSAHAPGPLPLLGAGAGFAWSRRLRRRVVSNKATV
jgi:hypothetical protein